jgi:hypothetical protein
MIEKGRQALEEDIPFRKSRQIGSRDGVLRIDPSGDIRIAAYFVLEPAVGIGDALAEMLVSRIDLFCFG